MVSGREGLLKTDGARRRPGSGRGERTVGKRERKEGRARPVRGGGDGTRVCAWGWVTEVGFTLRGRARTAADIGWALRTPSESAVHAKH